MITSSQCRAGRALVGWSQQRLADAARIGIVTVRQFEAGASEPRNATLEVMTRALETAGVVFQAEGQSVDGGPGVRLKRSPGEAIGLMLEELNAANDG